MKWPFGKMILLACRSVNSCGFLFKPSNRISSFGGQLFMSTTTPSTPLRFDDKFSLPKRDVSKLPLSIKNTHPNDSNLSFDSVEHKYFYKSKPLDISITGLVNKYFPEFRADDVIPKMMSGPNWPRKEYQYKDGTPYTAEEIKFKWDQIGLYSRNRGTWMHYNIESFLNGLPYDTEGPEMQFFLKFYDDYFKDIKPFRTEWTIAAPDRSIGGTVDFVGQLESGNYCIMDWKRSKGLAEGLTNNFGKHALRPVEHLDDCEGARYGLQINLYRHILETYYSINIESMYIVSFHPKPGSYALVEVPPLDEEVALVLEDYAASK